MSSSVQEQLILEVYVRNLRVSIDFLISLGFTVVRIESDFAVLGWETMRLFLYLPHQNFQVTLPQQGAMAGNIRVMVPDVDATYDVVVKGGKVIVSEIGDRPYGLRDFIVAGPDSIGIRFASKLKNDTKE